MQNAVLSHAKRKAISYKTQGLMQQKVD